MSHDLLNSSNWSWFRGVKGVRVKQFNLRYIECGAQSGYKPVECKK